MDTLIASTQYTDLRGTAAADHADSSGLASYLKASGLMSDSEFVIAVSFYSSQGTFIRALVVEQSDRESISNASQLGEAIHPPSLRAVRLELTLDQFFAFFKRFSVCIVESGYTGALNEINIDNLPE